MANGRRPYPYFEIWKYEVASLIGQVRLPWAYYAQTLVRLQAGSDPRRRSGKLPVRLDTGAFFSLLPEKWVRSSGSPLKSLGLRVSSASVPFVTAAGSGQASLLQGETGTVFTTDPGQRAYPFDWLVSANLNDRDFGLIALRDVVNHFFIRAEGRCEFGESGEPVELPDLELVPRAVWDRVRYSCPRREASAWGRSGMHLVCGDHNTSMTVAP